MSIVEVSMCVPTEFTVVKVRLTQEAAARVEKLLAEGKCLACGVELGTLNGKPERTVCGVHCSCDQTQRHAIRIGKETVASLIKRGERLAPGHRGLGRPPKTDYGAKLLGRTKQKDTKGTDQ